MSLGRIFSVRPVVWSGVGVGVKGSLMDVFIFCHPLQSPFINTASDCDSSLLPLLFVCVYLNLSVEKEKKSV